MFMLAMDGFFSLKFIRNAILCRIFRLWDRLFGHDNMVGECGRLTMRNIKSGVVFIWLFWS